MNALTLAQQNAIVDLDIGSVMFVRFTPNRIGDPIFRELVVDGIEHSITPGGHAVKLNLFEPFLRRFSGSVSGLSGTAGFVTGEEGNVGTIVGLSGTAGSVTGAEGNVGTIIGSSDSSGTVVGVKSSLFTLDTSELDSTDTLGA